MGYQHRAERTTSLSEGGLVHDSQAHDLKPESCFPRESKISKDLGLTYIPGASTGEGHESLCLFLEPAVVYFAKSLHSARIRRSWSARPACPEISSKPQIQGISVFIEQTSLSLCPAPQLVKLCRTPKSYTQQRPPEVRTPPSKQTEKTP